MTQHDLDRQVAAATGESVATIAAMGFSLLLLQLPEPRRRRERFPADAAYRNKGRRKSRSLRRRSLFTPKPSVRKGA